MGVPIGTVTYGAAAAAFLFLSFLLVTSWRGRLRGFVLAAASVTTCLWAIVAAYWSYAPGMSATPAEMLEVLRTMAWLAFLTVLVGYSYRDVQRLRIMAAVLFGVCLVALVATFFLSGGLGKRADTFVVSSRLILAIVGMVLIEQLFRNVHPQQRWGIKFLCFGLGGIFACDFYLYSDALLFRRVSEDIWAARGVVDALVVPLLAVATARNPNWSLDVAVSRRFVFHSAAMVGAALYLFIMAAAGYYVRYFGGNWGAVLQVTFLFGAVLLLFAVLSSGTLRARLKVLLSKHFFTYHYDYREEWLRFTRTLSTGEPGVQLHERSIQAIAELVDSPGGALWIGSDSAVFERVAHWNMPSAAGTVAADGPLVKFLQERQWVIDLVEYQSTPTLYDGLEVPEWLRSVPHAWVVVPLMLHERLLGFVLLARSKANVRLNWEVNDILKTGGRQAASYLAQLEAAKSLLVARQFESFNRMSAFVVHDLKNLVAQLSLMLSNADKHRQNPAFQQDMVETVGHSVEKMKRLLAQLRGVYTLEAAEPVTLQPLLMKIVEARTALKPAPRLEARDSVATVMGHPSRLERVIGHLVQNAVDATPHDGDVIIKLSRQNDRAIVEISDTGCGMTEHFMKTRLFKPFESTKALGMGIGTYEARQYVQELGGRIDVQSAEGRGAVFRIVLPLHETRRQDAGLQLVASQP